MADIGRREFVIGGLATAAMLPIAACAGLHEGPNMAEPTQRRPIIIAHRGASGERPEHTLESYRLAIAQGADFIEPDLVLTLDGILVARHENEISGTTDVAIRPEFAKRRATKLIDGESVSGWFTEDFTLAELKTLRARERLPQLRQTNTVYDGQFTVPTFDEILSLVADHRRATGQWVGVYPETKHPSYFAAIGLPHAPPLLDLLNHYGYTQADHPVFIQSFEVDNLIALHAQTPLRLIQLLDARGHPADQPDRTYADMVTARGLTDIARYASGIGPAKDMIIARTPDGVLAGSTGLVARAHAAGLAVHPWTFRAENFFLPANLRSAGNPAAPGDLTAEIRTFVDEGVDGIFTDNPVIASALLARA